jgi:hypothetical protein
MNSSLSAEVLIPSLGKAFDNIGQSYQQFICADKKADRIKMLWNIRLSAIDIHGGSKALLEALTGALITPAPMISPSLTYRVQASHKGDIHMQILNLDQLFKRFIFDKDPKEQIQYLYQIHKLSAEIADTVLSTNAEPDRGTERA